MIRPEIARAVRERAKGVCEYCLLAEVDSPFSFHVEHIIPKAHRGSDDIDNLALACPQCNQRKGTNLTGIDPDTGQLTPLFNPRTERWDDHFSLKQGRILPATAVARTTLGSWI